MPVFIPGATPKLGTIQKNSKQLMKGGLTKNCTANLQCKMWSNVHKENTSTSINGHCFSFYHVFARCQVYIPTNVQHCLMNAN